MLNSEQVCALLEAVNTYDSFTAFEAYDALTLTNASRKYRIGLDEIFQVCIDEGFYLPFGADTILHKNNWKKLKKALKLN
jgi:hypothetical protein